MSVCGDTIITKHVDFNFYNKEASIFIITVHNLPLALIVFKIINYGYKKEHKNEKGRSETSNVNEETK